MHLERKAQVDNLKSSPVKIRSLIEVINTLSSADQQTILEILENRISQAGEECTDIEECSATPKFMRKQWLDRLQQRRASISVEKISARNTVLSMRQEEQY